MENLLSKIEGKRISVPAKTILLEAGSVSKNIFFIKEGCARLWFNNDGVDITLQFFMAGQMVSSFDSLLHDTPSQFTLETILPTEIEIYKKEDISHILNEDSEIKNRLVMQAFDVASKYVNLFLSRIKDTPQQRYEKLLMEQPEIVAQIPQHYIASYLGITAVSLSRIRARILKS
ncbi:MAG: Crp/Fnr family transcriptional regulator [Alistipes sp.]|nr:Crp/Fnr family transcriptional regulator [Alistipes sp.]